MTTSSIRTRGAGLTKWLVVDRQRIWVEPANLMFDVVKEDIRVVFDRDPAAYCDKYGLDGRYKALVLKKDFLGMLRAGANIYYLAKMAIPRGTSVQDAGAQLQGMTREEFQRKLLAKGDGLVEKLKTRGGYWVG